MSFLKEYDQVLVADAYGGYNGVVAGNQITRAGCWAHLGVPAATPRKFTLAYCTQSWRPGQTGG
jgi:hypothetical protein